jgi:hypothetical protein
MFKKLALLFLAVLLGSLWFTILPPHVNASSTTKLYVDPASIINQALIPNTTFNISIKVDNIPANPGIVGVQFVLSWDPAVLNGTDMEDVIFHQTMPPAEVKSNLWILENDVEPNNATYAYTYVNTKRAISMGYAPISGNYTVATITLEVVGIGKCALELSTVKLGAPSGSSLPVQVVNGFFSNVPPPPPALLYVDPPKISNITLTPGSDFTVNVSIASASGVYGLQFSLSFNATMLQASTVTPGSFIPPSATTITQIDNTTGFVIFNVSVSSSLDGNGTLAQISFHVEALGRTTLHLYSVNIVDEFGLPLAYSTADGSFDNVLLAKLAIDPPQIIDPALVPPATFMVNVTIEEVRGLYGYQFNLTYNPSILVCLQVQIQDVLNETNYVPNQYVDNGRGFVFINVTYYSPAVPLDLDSPTAFVGIKFRVKTIGGTNLTLTDTHLVDSAGQPITHEDHNGYFQSLIVDIAVLGVSVSPTEIYKGWSTNITIIVANVGNSSESFALNVYYNSTLLTSVNVTGLTANANATVIVPWNTGTVNPGKYVISAYVPPLLYETNVANNNFTDGSVKVKIPGDLNGDGTVDISDAIILSAAFDSTPGAPNWNPAADLNGDGTVDILDAIMLAAAFGSSW